MKKKKIGVIIGIIVFMAFFASLYFDEILIKGASLLRNNLLNNFFLVVTLASSTILIFFILTSLLLWEDRKRRWIFPLWLTLGFSSFIGLILKVIIQRARPFQLGLVSLLPNLQKASHYVWNFSFPSSHAILAFCALPILSKEFPKLKWVWIGFAILIAFSRVYFGVHFVSDVIAGGLIGYVTGMLIVKLEEDNQFGKRVYEKIFKR